MFTKPKEDLKNAVYTYSNISLCQQQMWYGLVLWQHLFLQTALCTWWEPLPLASAGEAITDRKQNFRENWFIFFWSDSCVNDELTVTVLECYFETHIFVLFFVEFYNGCIRKLLTETDAKCFSLVTRASRLTLLLQWKRTTKCVCSSLYVNTVGISCAIWNATSTQRARWQCKKR